MKNPIKASIDFDRDGVQHGFLQIPYSRNDSAWGSIMLPITQAKNGDAPGALLTGGNHGDEYEGPIALHDLASRIDADSIQGRVIIVPMMNYPAFLAGTRVSPIDQLNMNRIFPGQVPGTITQLIADYFTTALLPLCDFVLDVHSGGKTLEFLPFAAYHELPNPVQQADCEAATRAFGAPWYLSLIEIDAMGMYDTQAEAMGKVFVSTELGGGGSSTPETVAVGKRGVHNFLEPCVGLGDRVQIGDLIARVHSTERTGVAAVEYRASSDGIVMGRHFPSLIKTGDFLNVIAREVQD